MNNELDKILKQIQYKTGQKLTEIAENIGYSRSYLSSVRASGGNDTIIQLLRAKYNTVLDDTVQKFDAAREHYIQQGHSANAPTIGQDQANTLLIAINSATYANTELLCELLAKAKGEPIDQVRARANQLPRAKLRTVEQLLDRLIPVSSGNSTKSDSN